MSADLNNYAGMACEITTMNNDLLASGKITRVITEKGGTAIEVMDINKRKMPHGSFDLPVKIKIHSEEYGTLLLGGKVFIGNREFWRIYDIKTLVESERRGFFRVKVLSPAMVTLNCGEEVQYDGVITNLSLSGLMLVIKNKDCELGVDDKVVVKGFGMNGMEEFTFNCVVRRIGEHPVAGWMYGCEFKGMDHIQSDNLCKLIFALQREEIKKKRRRI